MQPELRVKARALLGTDDPTAVKRSEEDVLGTPLPGETLAMFYARSRATFHFGAIDDIF